MYIPIQTDYSAQIYPPAPSTAPAAAKGGSFLEAIQHTLSASKASETRPLDAQEYKKYLEKRFGPVTLQSVGKDQKSLDAVGKKMRGNDIYIAPNVFDEMVNDLETAAFYEKKISYFFTDVIPNGQAYAQSVGLTFEPCGVVIHEDGTVTYICGGGDPPEKVAKVAAENQAKQQKRAERRKELMALSDAQAALRRALWQQLARTDALQQSASAASPVYSAGEAVESGQWLKLRQLTAPGLSAAEDMVGIAFHIL